VFAENERLCTYLALPGRDVEALCIAAVGATLVGKVHVRFDELTTQAGLSLVERRYDDVDLRLAKGEEWGRFEFGSTLVLIAAAGALTLEAAAPGTRVRLGTRIGRLA
jgi:phosphatidylserine decarboxylase